MSAGKRYSFDTSSLMHAWHRAYRPRNFPVFWRQLEEMVLADQVVASIEVFHEIARRDDDLFEWCKGHREMFVEIDDACQREVARIMGRHPRLVDTVKGRSGADPFVLAVATAASPRMTVVTEEALGRTRIPDVCRAEGLEWLNIADFIESQDWRF